MVALGPDREERLLRHARQLWQGREFPALAEALAPLGRDELLAEPSLGFYLADAWHRLGRRDHALALLRELEPAMIRRGNDPLARERLNLEGVLRFATGDLAGAEQAWTRLLEAAMRAGDEALVARVNHNFGVVYTLRGDCDRALLSYHRATAAYQRLGYMRGLAQVHNNLGVVLREMDQLRDADRHFVQSMDYAQADGSQDEAARAQIERSVLLCYERDLLLAEGTARQALRTWERLGDVLHVGESHRALAIVAMARRSWDRAQEHADHALARARDARAALLEAEIHDVLALLTAQRGDPETADALRARAAELFTAMAALPWGQSLRTHLERMVLRE